MKYYIWISEETIPQAYQNIWLSHEQSPKQCTSLQHELSREVALEYYAQDWIQKL
jgi:hypothetical protein